MADNVQASPGSGGPVFATDFNSGPGEHWPIVKSAWGQRDSAYNIVDKTVSAAFPVQQVGSQATWTNKSGTITSGGVAQTLMALNANRRGFWVQNLSSTDLYINETGSAAASQPSIKIPPNGLYESPAHGCPTAAISIFGATTSQAFSSREIT